MDEKDQLGRPKRFQISFYTAARRLSNFKRVCLTDAVRCGLPGHHQNSKHLVGVKPLVKGKHIYSVHMRLITELNHTPVVP